MQTFGEKLTLLRKQNGVSQEELAFKIGVSRQTVHRWEKNKIQPLTENIVALCGYFNVKPDYLLSGGEFTDNADVEVISEPLPAVNEISISAYTEADDVLTVHSIQPAENILIYQTEEEKPKKKSRKTAFLAVLAVTLTVAVLILLFFAYLNAPEEGAYSTASSSTWNFDDVTTILQLIAVVLAFAVLCIAVYFIVRHFKNKKK